MAPSSDPAPAAPVIVPAPDAATMPPTDALARVQAFAADAMRAVSDTSHALADHAARLGSDGGRYVGTHPGSTLGTAFAASVAVGLLLGLRD